MTPTSEQQAVPVAQEDREAAADLIELIAQKMSWAEPWLLSAETWRRGHRGRVDCMMVPEAFARHRLARLTPIEGVAASGGKREFELDWRLIAKAAGEHGVRYRTNAAMTKFLAAVTSPAPSPAIPEGTSGEGVGLGHDIRNLAFEAVREQFTPDATQTREAEIPADDEELAMALCEADGHDPHEMTYHFTEPGVQEPYGGRWNHYVAQATRLRAALSAGAAKGEAR